jgi:hypothetical protein
MQDRNGLTIKGKYVLHSVARRDYYCSCGHKVTTRWYEEEPHWRSVCSNDESHDQDGFIHTNALPYVQQQVMVEDMASQEVWEGLPEEFRESVKGGTDGD